MLKKIAATGIVATAAAGFMLLGGAANADSLSVSPTSHGSYYPGDHHGWGRWHHRHHRHQWHGWGRWHHRDHRRFYFHY